MPALFLSPPSSGQEAQDKPAAGSEGHRTKYVTTFKLRLQTTTEQEEEEQEKNTAQAQQDEEGYRGRQAETMAVATTKAEAAFC